jgi:hypothetical protein
MPEKQRTAVSQTISWKPVDYPTVYSNLLAVGITPFDVSLVFGDVEEATTTDVLGVPRVKVILAPEQAANVLKMLTTALTQYIATNGKLRESGNAETLQEGGKLP